MDEMESRLDAPFAPPRIPSADEPGRDIIEVVLSWSGPPLFGRRPETTVLDVRCLAAGGALTLGERGDVLVPAEVLGADRVEIVRYEEGIATVFVPERASAWIDDAPCEERVIDLRCGGLVDMAIGAFVVRVARTRAVPDLAGPSLAGLRRNGGYFAGSALIHGAAFIAVAFFAPALGATEEDPFDVDRLALIQRLLNASAEREHESPPADSADPSGGGGSEGSPAQGAEGEAGKRSTDASGRYAVQGTAKPETAAHVRESALAAAETFGLVGLLPSLVRAEPSVPVVSWGTELRGSDDVTRIGGFFAGSIDDARGTGALGPSGLEEGGGGAAHAIGRGEIAGLGSMGSCGAGCDGVGVGRGRPSGGHTPRFKGPRYTSPTVNGRLDPAIIQRVVRLNDGRYRFCYENGLRSDPTLQGRVTVKFVIGRSGAVAVAADGGSDIPDQAVRRCVVQSFMTLSFPEPESGSVTVLYPIVFSPD